MFLYPAMNVDLVEIEKTAQEANALYTVMIIFLFVITLILLINTALVAYAFRKSRDCQQVISSSLPVVNSAEIYFISGKPLRSGGDCREDNVYHDGQQGRLGQHLRQRRIVRA